MVERLDVAIGGLINRTEERINATMSRIIIDVGETLISRTPVQTGRLVNNWVVSFDNPQAQSPENSPNPSATDSFSEIQSAANLFDINLNIDTISFVNTIPYGKFVEFGTFKMRPRAFVRSTVADAPQIVSAAVRSFNIS